MGENSLDEMGGFDLPTGTTKKDMQEMKDLFNLFDIDGNGSITQSEFRIVMESLGHSITEEQSIALVDEFDVDDTEGIEIFEFIAMIKKYQEVYKVSEIEELVNSIKRLNTKREGIRYDKLKVSETINSE